MFAFFVLAFAATVSALLIIGLAFVDKPERDTMFIEAEVWNLISELELLEQQCNCLVQFDDYLLHRKYVVLNESSSVADLYREAFLRIPQTVDEYEQFAESVRQQVSYCQKFLFERRFYDAQLS